MLSSSPVELIHCIAMPLLTSDDRTVVTQRFKVAENPVLIGRHPECSIQIDDGSVSRHHAKITFDSDSGNWFVEDLRSRNGTWIDEQPVHQKTKLNDRARVRICDVSFQFRLSETGTDSMASDSSFFVPKPTHERAAMGSSIVMADDNGDSKYLSRLEIPSHHRDSSGCVNAEKKLQALTGIAHALSESVDRDELLDRILKFLFDLFGEADRGFVMLKDTHGHLKPLGFRSRHQTHEEVRVSRTICHQVMETKIPVLSSDAGADGRFDMSQSVVDFRIRSIMCAPLLNSNDESIGVIQLDTLKKSVVFRNEDLETLVTIAMQASLAIQKADLFEQAARNRSLKADLELAQDLQLKFLPQAPPAVPNYEFFSYYQPMQQVGGDYFDYLPLDEDRTGIIVADVVGHGIAAAMLMAKVSAEARIALKTSETAEAAMNQINLALSGLHIDRFVTMGLSLINRRDDTLTVVNAGHMPPLIRRADGSVEEAGAGVSGLPVGILEEETYESYQTQLHTDDVVVMYTDGLNEAMNKDDEQLTTGAMIAELRQHPSHTARSIGERMVDRVRRHMGDREPIDDMCLVCFGKSESD